MKNWQNIGVLAVLIVGFLLISGCMQDNDKYCRENFPGTAYDPSSKMCEHTTTPTPAQQTNPQGANDQLFLSTAIKYNDEISIATQIFAKIITEEDRWLSNIENKELEYQSALDYLAKQKGSASDLSEDYYNLVLRAGNDVAEIRRITMAYNDAKAVQEKNIALAQKIVDAKKAAILDAEKKPIDLKSKGLDVNILGATCSRAIDQLTPIKVSSELQPVKDQYLTAISNFKNGGDSIAIADNYFSQGQVSSGTDAYQKGIAYIETGTNQLDSTTLLIQQYRTKLGI